jgi:hypothetical protein
MRFHDDVGAEQELAHAVGRIPTARPEEVNHRLHVVDLSAGCMRSSAKGAAWPSCGSGIGAPKGLRSTRSDVNRDMMCRMTAHALSRTKVLATGIRYPTIASSLLVVSWFPVSGFFQVFVYLAIPTLVAFWIITHRANLSRIGTALVLAVLTVSGLGLVLEGSHAMPLNGALALLTYGSTLLLLLRFRVRTTDYGEIVVISAWLVFIEVAIAIGQFVIENRGVSFQAMSAGDAVVGTLLAHSHLFVVKMLAHFFVLLSAVVLGVRRRVAALGMYAALVGIVLGSALLTMILAAVGLLLFLYLVPANHLGHELSRAIRRLRVTFAVVLGVATGMMLWLQPDNVAYISREVRGLRTVLTTTAAGEGRGKVVGTVDSLRLLTSNPKVLLFGTGLGHYSSRAALILSGGYLTHHPSFIPVSVSRYTSSHILPRWNPTIWSRRYLDGVMNQPFQSVQSVVLELGLTGTALVAFAYFWSWARVLRIGARGKEARSIQLAALLALSAIPMILLSDNWLEYPHAFVPLVLPILLSLNLRRSVDPVDSHA